MSTIYVFDSEVDALVTGATGDKLLVADVSAGTKKAITIGNLQTVISGASASSTLGFYGVTKVNQGTMTATAVTALATATISAANTSVVWGFASSTVANAYVARTDQMQVDLDTLMAKIHSTGLLAISGL